MGDAYWNHQAPLPQSAGLLKRPRSEYVPEVVALSGMSSGHEVHHYLGRDDDRGGPRVVDTHSIGSAYDRYLQSSQLSSLSVGEANKGVGLARPSALPVLHPSAHGPEVVLSGQLPVESMPRPRETMPLPPDASNTLYIEGLPSDSTRREVAHIFRPFVGYKEVRLVRKESKHRGGDPLILCFVDFVDPACAATALSALQGYKMDEHDSESVYLRLQFSRFPGARSGGSGSRGKR